MSAPTAGKASPAAYPTTVAATDGRIGLAIASALAPATAATLTPNSDHATLRAVNVVT
jgi:hypothetical protein